MKLVKNQLGYGGDVFIYQDKEMFNYSVDTILLGNFATISKNTKHILDIGTNNGALAIFVALRTHLAQIEAIEIQSKAVAIAKLNVKENNFQTRISVLEADFNHYWKEQVKNNAPKYDLIICNPPFYKVGTTLKRKGSDAIYDATHESRLTLEQLVAGASKILKIRGYLSIVMPTERLVDIFANMRKYDIEPKRVQMIYPRTFDKANLVLVEGRFKSGWGTKFMPNIYLHYDDRDTKTYRDEVIKMYVPHKIKKEQK